MIFWERMWPTYVTTLLLAQTACGHKNARTHATTPQMHKIAIYQKRKKGARKDTLNTILNSTHSIKGKKKEVYDTLCSMVKKRDFQHPPTPYRAQSLIIIVSGNRIRDLLCFKISGTTTCAPNNNTGVIPLHHHSLLFRLVGRDEVLLVIKVEWMGERWEGT